MGNNHFHRCRRQGRFLPENIRSQALDLCEESSFTEGAYSEDEREILKRDVKFAENRVSDEGGTGQARTGAVAKVE